MRFDLLLLGFGSDGHTASLFPGSVALDEKVRSVVAVTAAAQPPTRLTLTLPSSESVRKRVFSCQRSTQAYALDKVLSGNADQRTCPAAGVRPDRGAVAWWIERVQGYALRSESRAVVS